MEIEEQPLWRTIQRLLQRLKIQLPNDPATEFISQKDEHTNSKWYILNIWVEKRWPNVHNNTINNNQDVKATKVSINRWMDKIPYTVEYCSATKKNKILPFAATGTDLEIIILSTVNWETQISYIIYLWNLKKNKSTYLQNRNRVTDTENKLMPTKQERGRNKLGAWKEQIQTTIYNINKHSLFSTGNCIQYLVIT